MRRLIFETEDEIWRKRTEVLDGATDVLDPWKYQDINGQGKRNLGPETWIVDYQWQDVEACLRKNNNIKDYVKILRFWTPENVL